MRVCVYVWVLRRPVVQGQPSQTGPPAENPDVEATVVQEQSEKLEEIQAYVRNIAVSK